MPILYLHVGAGKTGTSFLQSQCALQHRLLADHGLWYPVTERLLRRVRKGKVTSGNLEREMLGWLCPSHPKLADHGAKQHQLLPADWLGGLLAEAEGRNVLLSSETLQFADPERVSQLAQHVTEVDYTLRILFYGRHALDHAISNYREHLQGGFHRSIYRAEHHSLNGWLRQRTVPFKRTLGVYCDVVGKDAVVVRSYDAAKHQLFNCFLSNVGISAAADLEPVDSFSTVNRSLTVVETQFLERAANVLTADQIAAFGVVLTAAPPCDAAIAGASGFSIDPAALEVFKQRHVPMFAKINQDWADTLEQPLEVVPSDFEGSSVPADPDHLLAIAMHLLSIYGAGNVSEGMRWP
jgi:hypothetical protein